MRKEILIERIAKAEEFIAKKEGTISKKTASIQKKSEKFVKTYGSEWMTVDKYDQSLENHNEMYWDICEIEHLQSDIRSLEKQIAEKQTSLENYKEDLKKEEEKEASRNIKVILDFLEDWKKRNIEFFNDSLPRYSEAYKQYCKESHEWTDYYNSNWKDRGSEEFKKVEKEWRETQQRFKSEWNFITPYIGYKFTSEGKVLFLDLNKLQKDLDQEANRKYDFIIERTNEIVGEITDASDLRIGQKADLNGLIVGTRGTASVQTIGAGGYNIQCYHFRTLINKVR